MAAYLKRNDNLLEIYGILLTDCICVILSYLLAILLRYRSFALADHKETYILVCIWILLFTVLYDILVGSGRNFLRRGYYVEFKSVAKHITGMVIFLGCSLFLFKEAENFSRLVFGYYIILETVFMLSTHFSLKKLLRVTYRADKSKIKVMVITDSASAQQVLPLLLAGTEYDCEIASAVIWDVDMTGQEISGIPVVAYRENVVDTVKNLPVDEVFLYLPEVGKTALRKLIMDFEVMGIACHYNIDVADLDTKVRSVGEFAGFTVVTYAIHEIDRRRAVIKRLMDIAGGLVGLLITGILYPFVALFIKLDSKGPVVFSQVRIGKNGRRFRIYKFRSMYLDAEKRKKELEAQNEMQGLMFKMEDDPRVTRVGRFIRKTSIDELPQFWNVLKGDMSLVGTRPPTEDEFAQYTPYYRRRLCMTPGLTGLWQVSGRSNVENFDDVVKYDLHYIDHWSLSLDIKILFQTVFVVLFGKGAK